MIKTSYIFTQNDKYYINILAIKKAIKRLRKKNFNNEYIYDYISKKIYKDIDEIFKEKGITITGIRIVDIQYSFRKLDLQRYALIDLYLILKNKYKYYKLDCKEIQV